MTLRPASIDDAAEIARLSGELGYPAEPDEMSRRLAVLIGDPGSQIVVDFDGDGRLLGWVHVAHRMSLEGGEGAELLGLVVDSSARRRGVGAQLVAAAEQWASARGAPAMRVRSNAVRELSHPFYRALDYALVKTQHVYSKSLRFRSGDGRDSRR